MDGLIRLDEDWHVSSTFSNGTATVEETVYAAEARGLSRLCVVDKVRGSTGWVGDFVQACLGVGRETAVEVSSGIEAEILDTSGTLELPRFAGRADYVYVAANRLPTPRGPMYPEEARAQIAAGRLLPARVIEWLVRALANAAMRDDSVVLAQPFRILPELGIDARAIHPAYVCWLAGELVDREASIEVSERWRCPSPSVVRHLLTAGVTVRASTGSDSPETVGRYAWCQGIAAELADVAPRQDYSEPLHVAAAAQNSNAHQLRKP